MAIIVILLGAGVAGYYGMGEGARMRAAISNLRSTFMLARQQAILNGQPLDVILGKDDDKDTYYYSITNRVAGRAVGETRYLPPGVRIKSGEPSLPCTISFRPEGGTDSPSPVRIKLVQGTSGLDWTIEVYGLTGLVRVTEP